LQELRQRDAGIAAGHQIELAQSPLLAHIRR
jgi:hypothetical protein